MFHDALMPFAERRIIRMNIKNGNIGKIINHLRQEKKITLKKLCYGICSVSTLHRIETGEREGDIFLLQRLLEKLGGTLEDYEVFISKKELENYMHQEEIRKLMKKEIRIETEIALERYKRNIKGSNILQEQFVKEVQAYFYKIDKNYINAIKCLEEAISMTVIKDSDIFLLSKVLLCRTELELFIELADNYELLNEKEKTNQIHLELWKYLERNKVVDEKNMDLYLKVIYQIANYYMKMKEVKLTLFICNKVIKLEAKNTYLYYLPEFIYLKALCIQMIYGKIKYEEEVYLSTQVYYIFRLMNKFERAAEVKKFIEVKLNGNL